jgi:hypothetical protein
MNEFPFSVDLLIVGHEDASTESQKDLMAKKSMQDYNNLSDDMQIVSIIVSRKLNSAENSSLNKEMRNVTFVAIWQEGHSLPVSGGCPFAFGAQASGSEIHSLNPARSGVDVLTKTSRFHPTMRISP